jgi:hypothetical protein
MVKITLRLPDDLHDAIAEIANQKDRSLNAQIIRALRHCVAMEKQTDATEKAEEGTDAL